MKLLGVDPGEQARFASVTVYNTGSAGVTPLQRPPARRPIGRSQVNDTPSKACTKCGLEKLLTEFRPDYRNGKLRPMCRACERLQANERNARNRDQMQKRSRDFRTRHLEQERERGRTSYAANCEHISERRKANRLKNLERERQRSRDYYSANAEARREQGKRWASTNPEYYRMASRSRRARKKAAEGSYTKEQWEAKIKAHKGRCHWCQQRIDGTPHADHLIALAKGGSNDISNIVPACKSCNCKKHTKLPWEFMPGRLL